jgi:CheY-like chemotaxis protein
MIRKVLFVDDDQIMLLALEKRLAKYNDTFSIVLAEDGFDAVRKLKENAVSLVVLDLKMPRMDGVSLLAHITDKYSDIPVIIISGYRTEEMHRLAKEKEVVAFITKPFQVDDLAKLILSTLRKEAEGGTLHNVSPVVFLQLMEMEARTCTIRLIDSASEKGGVLIFKEGKLYDARVDQVKGINAAYIIFTWEDVTLFIRNDCSVQENMINSSLQPIIMKAVGMKDEQVTEIPDEDDSHEEEDSLEDIDLPEGIILPKEDDSTEEDDSAKENDLIEVSQLPKEEPNDEPDEVVAVPELDEEPIIDKVRNLLLREIGEKCGLDDIYHDDKADGIVHSLSELGAMFNFGAFKVGYIDRGKTTHEVIVPADPPIIIKVSPKCPQDKILQVLSMRM